MGEAKGGSLFKFDNRNNSPNYFLTRIPICIWWRIWAMLPSPSACRAGALLNELIPHIGGKGIFKRASPRYRAVSNETNGGKYGA